VRLSYELTLSRRRLLTAAVTGVITLAMGAPVAGCNMIPGAADLTARRAENPLKGEPVVWTEKPLGLPIDGERTCTTWPIENALSVKATATEICVEGAVYALEQSGASGAKEEALNIESDGAGNASPYAGLADSLTARPQKVGSCSDSAGVREVWVSRYSGCVPNKTMSETPSLTMQSTFLRVGPARWKFDKTPATTPPPTGVSTGTRPAPG
jgi:hypothetical protein